MSTLSIHFEALRQQRKFSKVNISIIYALTIFSQNCRSVLSDLRTQFQWPVPSDYYNILKFTIDRKTHKNNHNLLQNTEMCFVSKEEPAFYPLLLIVLSIWTASHG